MTATAITERKIKPDGSVREYACLLLHAEPNLVVIRYAVTGGSAGFAVPLVLPPGSTSDGYFWRNKHYNLYRFRGPGGEVLGHRLDAVTDVRFAPGLVEYRDLAVDWWVLADGTLIEEDRDELDSLAASGALRPADIAAANDASRQVYSRYRHIIDGAEGVEARIARHLRKES